jgi:predicted ATPase
MALKGWPAQEVWDSLHPALALAHSLRRRDSLVRILHGHWVNVLSRGRLAESLYWVTQLQKSAAAYQDTDLLIMGRTAAAISYFWLGELTKSRENADRVLALYSEERHGHLVGILNHELKTNSLIFRALSAWMLGYPDQAVKISDERDGFARRIGHPFDLGFALTIGSILYDHLGQPDEQLKRAEEADRVGRESSLPILSECLAPACSGIAFIRKGRVDEGTASLEQGLAVWAGSGGQVLVPYFKSVLAEAMAQLAELGRGLHLIDESIEQIERSGWEERWYLAEILRIKGWLLSLKGDPEGAERANIASLDWARTQQAKSWELRTATSYARLLRDQNRGAEAHALLAPVYAWFTEGFGTKDLKEAKALLDELSADQSRGMGDGVASAPASSNL